MVAQLGFDARLERLLVDALHLLDDRARDVRRHDDDDVLEVHGAALAVREAAVVEHLQEDGPDVGMGLLDLVEEDDGVGPAAHGFRELAALVVADVAGRRPDHAGDRVLLLVLGHVEADHRVLVVEEELRERAGELGLADARGAEEEERADGPLRVLHAGAGPADGRGHGLHGLVLPDDAQLQPLVHLQELLRLALDHLRDGHAGPLRDDRGDVLLVHLLAQDGAVLLELVEAGGRRLEVLLELRERAVPQLGGLVQVALALGGLGRDLRLVELLLEVADRR